jgi:hypothetical protein
MALGRPLSPLSLSPSEKTTVVGLDSPSQDGAGTGVARPHRAAQRWRPQQHRGGSHSACRARHRALASFVHGALSSYVLPA